MSDSRARRRLALGALQLFLLTTASLSLAAVARAQDATEPPEPAALTLQMGAPGVTTFSRVDEVINYDYWLYNIGGVVLDVVSVTDTKAVSQACSSEPLEPGGDRLCTGFYAITQADLDAGSVTIRARAHGLYGGSEGVESNEVSLTITAVATEPPALTLELGSVATTFSAVGDRIEYDYLLTNTGGVTLDAVSVSPKLGDVVCSSAPLRPDGVVLCIGYYYITQADLDAGSVTNVAQAHGTYGGSGAEVASEEASLTITAVAPEPAALTLQMGAPGVTTFSRVDEVINYDYWLYNIGGVVLDVVSVTDTKAVSQACSSEPLEPGGDRLCTGFYAITQADLDAGSVTIRARAHGLYGGSEGVESNEVSLTITAVATEPPALTLELGSVATTFSAVGDRIEYDYLLTNTGGVTLDAVSVSPKLGDVVCSSAPLRPDGVVLCIGYYYITQADLDAGSVTNVAQAHGTYGGSGAEVASEEASLTITAVAP